MVYGILSRKDVRKVSSSNSNKTNHKLHNWEFVLSHNFIAAGRIEEVVVEGEVEHWVTVTTRELDLQGGDIRRREGERQANLHRRHL